MELSSAPETSDVKTNTSQGRTRYITTVVVNITNTSFLTSIYPNHFEISAVTQMKQRLISNFFDKALFNFHLQVQLAQNKSAREPRMRSGEWMEADVYVVESVY